MIDIDYAPAVFAALIIFVLVAPALYGMFFVDSYRNWEKKGQDGDEDTPVF